MSYCLNPECPQPENPPKRKMCKACRKRLLLGGRYRAIAPIAAGGFGRTLLAEDEHKPSKQRCVIKQFYPDRRTYPDATDTKKIVALFHAEAERLEQLGKHPQIPELYAHFQQDSCQYIVQEYIDGKNLAIELQEAGAFSEVRAENLLKELLPVLQFIHRGNVIHRDIKPENIIRRRVPPEPAIANWKKELVLVDFGAAKYATATSLAKTGTVIGSAGYAAPEQIYGKPVFASDLYSLGVTCIHLLTQIPPFDLYDPHDGKYVWRDYLAGNSVSDRFAAIVDRLLENTVRDRYPNAEAVLADLCASSRVALQLNPAPKATIFASDRAPIRALAFSPEGERIASSSGIAWGEFVGRENNVRVRAVNSEKLLNQFPQMGATIAAIAFSPDGCLLAGGGRDRLVKVWDLQRGKLQRRLRKHLAPITSVQFAHYGKFLASASEDSTIALWNLETYQLERNFYRLPATAVYQIALSPDGNWIAIATANPEIEVRSLVTGDLHARLQGHSDAVYAIAFSPDSRLLASGSRDWDRTVRLWDVASGSLLDTLSSHADSVRAIAFAPDGRVLASGGSDRAIVLWDVVTRKPLRTLKGHKAAVTCLAFSPQCDRLASGSDDKTIRLWSLVR